jgi:beta-phosphoglucomutase-like phosphatase (HAD superfamily)
VTLIVKGPSEVHISGYFEPKGDDMDDDMFYGNEDAEEEAEEDEEESDEKPAAKPMKAIEANLKQAQANSAKNASASSSFRYETGSIRRLWRKVQRHS